MKRTRAKAETGRCKGNLIHELNGTEPAQIISGILARHPDAPLYLALHSPQAQAGTKGDGKGWRRVWAVTACGSPGSRRPMSLQMAEGEGEVLGVGKVVSILTRSRSRQRESSQDGCAIRLVYRSSDDLHMDSAEPLEGDEVRMTNSFDVYTETGLLIDGWTSTVPSSITFPLT